MVAAEGPLVAGDRGACRWPVVAAAAVTVVAAVVLDAAGGADLGHTVGLGITAALVALLRVHGWGRRHRAATATASALVLLQPALGVAGQASHRSLAWLGIEHGTVHDVLLALHLVLACAAVLALVLVDVALLGAVNTVARVLRVLAPRTPLPRHRLRQVCPVALGPDAALDVWVDYAMRRGPPMPVSGRRVTSGA